MGREFTGESAFVDAYSEYFDVVYREALRYSGNHHVAEEIAQDAFFMAYVQNGNESKQQIKAWMLMLAKYRAMNYIRDHKREVSLEEITMSEEKYPDALVDDSSEEYVIAMLKEQGFRKLGIDIFRELYQKKARWYQAVTLVYYVDMPQKEAAKQMGVTLYALEGMLKRARRLPALGKKANMMSKLSLTALQRHSRAMPTTQLSATRIPTAALTTCLVGTRPLTILQFTHALV